MDLNIEAANNPTLANEGQPFCAFGTEPVFRYFPILRAELASLRGPEGLANLLMRDGLSRASAEADTREFLNAAGGGRPSALFCTSVGKRIARYLGNEAMRRVAERATISDVRLPSSSRKEASSLPTVRTNGNNHGVGTKRIDPRPGSRPESFSSVSVSASSRNAILSGAIQRASSEIWKPDKEAERASAPLPNPAQTSRKALPNTNQESRRQRVLNFNFTSRNVITAASNASFATINLNALSHHDAHHLQRFMQRLMKECSTVRKAIKNRKVNGGNVDTTEMRHLTLEWMWNLRPGYVNQQADRGRDRLLRMGVLVVGKEGKHIFSKKFLARFQEVLYWHIHFKIQKDADKGIPSVRDNERATALEIADRQLIQSLRSQFPLFRRHTDRRLIERLEPIFDIATQENFGFYDNEVRSQLRQIAKGRIVDSHGSLLPVAHLLQRVWLRETHPEVARTLRTTQNVLFSGKDL